MINQHDILCAPLQGYTDHVWRNAHAKYFGGVKYYYSPFIRLEKGEIRRHDLKDVNPCNNNTNFIPQILACKPQEALVLTKVLTDMGYRAIDINLGCPHPPIAMRHKGAGMLKYPDEIREFLEVISTVTEVKYSVKMRLGWDEPEQWKEVLPLLDVIKPTQVTVHPRIGTQKYRGELNMEQFGLLLKQSPYPVIYNGEITSHDDITEIFDQFPTLSGIMMGRGLVAHPYLTATNPSIETLQQFHDELLNTYCEIYTGGDAQIVNKMKSLWELFLPEADHKARKTIKKSHSIEQYASAAQEAISSIKID